MRLSILRSVAVTDLSSRFRLDGRKALVTGASRGLGPIICEVLAAAGADIVAVARNEADLQPVCKIAAHHERKCLQLTADLAQAESVTHVARQALAEWGAIDVLVNNAGVSFPRSLIDQSVEEWDLIQAVNLRAPWLLARELAPAMIAQKRGKIINISSQTSSVALIDHGAYAASKNGLNGLTKVMTAEWAIHNIQANAICPTIVWTPMGARVWSEGDKLKPFLARMPAGRVATPEEIADVVLFLATQASDMVNGQELFVDGGYTAL
ncbi:3-oxoacyl-ACP reductase [Kozakia baliensis]|uniref:3-oxoacyl-ACP reductase n=1 Tax=Kozakia baliensis TaxID=153496 RepID=A0A1D8UV88_9PROT|nr:3-oxoacyl-ACP reductase [Kozakia baliensis]